MPDSSVTWVTPRLAMGMTLGELEEFMGMALRLKEWSPLMTLLCERISREPPR